MKKINLTKEKYSLISDIDFKKINHYKWYAHWGGNTFYAVRNFRMKNGKRKMIMMHRVIMKPPSNKEIDHIDGDGLNNQRNNLRICSHKQNLRNQGIPKNNTSGFKGVVWDKRDRRWRAQIRVNYKNIRLGSFKSKIEAHKEVVKAYKKYHKEFSRIL